MKIEKISMEIIRLSSAIAELSIRVHVPQVAIGYTLTGLLRGPLCDSIETIQLSYRLKYQENRKENSSVLYGTFIICEPNLWTKATPYIYQGSVELVHQNILIDSQPIQTAFRARNLEEA